MRGNERVYGRTRFPPIHQTKVNTRHGNSSGYKLLPSSIPCQYFPASNFRPVIGTRGNYDELTSFYQRNALEAPSANLREPSADAVRAFLDTHPDFLGRYVRERVPASRLRQWLMQKRKSKMAPGRPGPSPDDGAREPSVSRTFGRGMRGTFSSGGSPTTLSIMEKRRLLETIISDPVSESKKLRIFALLKDCLSTVVQSDGMNLYIVNTGDEETISKCLLDNDSSAAEQPIGPGTSVAAYVASAKETVRLPDKSERQSPDPRFPLMLNSNEDAHYILCVPLLQEEEKLAGVVELYRFSENEPFSKEDEEIVQSYLIWGGTAVTCSEICLLNRKQQRLNQFILQVTQSMFGKFKDKRHVIEDIMTHAKQLVNADRTSMFIVDRDAEEMVSMYFDNGTAESSQGALSARDIRFPLDRGIAGHVAITGETCNILDAYSDPRFNRDVDQQTGYKTKSILCMPVKLHEQVIGVVQMLNKVDDVFTVEDEEHFKTFASYCGLALHIAKMYETIRLSEQKYKVALEVLSYHSQYEPAELRNLQAMGVPDTINDIESFFYSPWSAKELEKPQQVLFMFRDLFGFEKFDAEILMRFTLTVRKNYRKVPYHNWAHAFSVAHSMYAILKGTTHRFSDEEGLAMFVGSLCHDLDHRGKTNQFMVRSASPLAEIYSTSTMEHHHFNMTVAILQREGHNIFQSLDSDKYKDVLATIKHCILATDLQRFETHRQQMTALWDEGAFSWSNEEHRLDLMAISMTTCDLCNMFKPWQLQVSLVLVVMDEFWTQGDEEKAQGELPTKMMDRDYKHELPESQVGFIQFVGLPCYTLLSKFLPEAIPTVNGAQENLDCWTRMSALARDVKDLELTQLESTVRSWKVENLCFN